MEKMSITRALAEKKLLEKRISKVISQSQFVSSAKNSSKDVTKGLTKEDFIKDAKASLQGIKDLIERNSKISTAIAISNATSDIEVAGGQYKVAEAIARKNNIELERELLNNIRYQLGNAKDNVEMKNHQVEQKLEQMIVAMVGKENAKNVTEETKKFSEQYLADNEFSIVDGVGAEKLVAEMEKEIDEFMFEIDFALSTHNSLTEIEI